MWWSTVGKKDTGRALRKIMNINIAKKTIAVIIIGTASVLCQALMFHDPEFLFCQGDTLRVIFYSAPAVYDWNGDGKKDLIVGQFINGNIFYYENIGTDSAPVFAAPQFLYADGSIISLPYS
jgi:hypothetical protein